MGRDVIRNAYMQRKQFANAVSELHVTKNKRSVRLTVTSHGERFAGNQRVGAGSAFVDLSDEQIDRLVRRLQAIRGGRRGFNRREGAGK